MRKLLLLAFLFGAVSLGLQTPKASASSTVNIVCPVIPPDCCVLKRVSNCLICTRPGPCF